MVHDFQSVTIRESLITRDLSQRMGKLGLRIIGIEVCCEGLQQGRMWCLE